MSFHAEDPRQTQLRGRLRELGFDDIRFAVIEAETDRRAPDDRNLQEWLGAGMQADMQWLDRSLAKRLNPDLVLPGARSMLLLGVNYWSGRPSHATAPRWARYALHDDYHDTIKPALVAAGRTLEQLYGVAETDYRYYVDTGPVIERGWAARAGLGFVGKNAMLISREYGNWLFLAAILTRIVFAPDAPIRKRLHVGSGRTGESLLSGPGETDSRVATAPAPIDPPAGLLCGKCTRCLDACPTDAFARPGVVDARRCISYHTIENKGVIPRELRAGIGNRIYGCDVCLDVCPWNRFARQARGALLVVRTEIGELPLRELLALTPERFAEVFRRTPIKRLKLVGLLRNACVVAGNSGDVALLPQLLDLAMRHALPLVRAHAVWAVFRLGGGAQLAAARTGEREPMVLAEYEAEDGLLLSANQQGSDVSP